MIEAEERPRGRDWGSEKLFTLSDISRHPRIPVERTYNTWRIWATHGVTADIGDQTVKLASIRIGGTLHTSMEAVREFFNELAEAGNNFRLHGE